MRLFIAIDLPPDVRRAIAALIDASRSSAPRARWADARTSHVTLHFLGEVAESALPELQAAVTSVAALHAPVRLELRHAGTFPHGGSRARVLWVGFDGGAERLGPLHADLRTAIAALGVALDDKPLRPHVTLARTREPRGDRALSAVAATIDAASLGAIDASEIVLYQSDLRSGGPVHTPLVRAPLRGGVAGPKAERKTQST